MPSVSGVSARNSGRLLLVGVAFSGIAGRSTTRRSGSSRPRVSATSTRRMIPGIHSGRAYPSCWLTALSLDVLFWLMSGFRGLHTGIRRNCFHSKHLHEVAETEDFPPLVSATQGFRVILAE